MEKQLQKFRKTFIALWAMIAAALVVGCGPLETTDTTRSTAPAITGDSAGTAPRAVSTVLQVGELIKVDFSGPASPPAPHEENIKEDGTITLYLIGQIKAAGKTPGQLQSEIQQLYVPRYYRTLNVTVRPADRFFTVGGEVRAPNRHLYLGPITVTGAIKASGDFTEFARKNRVKLTRADGTTHTIDANKAMERPSLDLPVYPGDIIHVPGRIF
ncbi:MAG: polysaccharide biosynthesis/export family protein [Limisphaerales bacterium]